MRKEYGDKVKKLSYKGNREINKSNFEKLLFKNNFIV